MASLLVEVSALLGVQVQVHYAMVTIHARCFASEMCACMHIWFQRISLILNKHPSAADVITLNGSVLMKLIYFAIEQQFKLIDSVSYD